jgi:putative transposase
MSRAERLKLIAPADANFSITRQCSLLKVARSTLYYQPRGVSAEDLELMRRMDEIYLRWPFYGSRRLVAELRGEGFDVGRKHVRRLMRLMGIEVIYQKPNTSRKQPDHAIYPYLLRNLAIERPDQVWCADITYVPMARGFVYLVAIMDWHSRYVLAWRLSITMETDFCVEALGEAMRRFGKPDIFNTDQGAQFTAAAFTGALAAQAVRISMDGKGRYLDNIFIERLWRSLKYEAVFLKAYASVPEARQDIGDWLNFYNDQRKHQALDYRTPGEIYRGAGATCGYVDKARALTTSPQALLQQQERDSIQSRKEVVSDRDSLAA